MWFIISIVLCIMLIISLVYHIIYRRQVEGLSRQTAFLNEKKTELKINTDLNAKELKSLAAEIRRLNDSFNETKISLMKQDAALRETITNLSHDIRTPLTSLDGYFQLLASEKIDQDKKEHYLGIIRNRIESLNSMLDELFTYAKLQDINYSIELSEIDITSVTADILMSFYDDIAGRGEEPDVSLPDEQVLINGNKEAYTRVVQNIIRNALVHGKNLSVSLRREASDVIFECSDELLNPDTVIDTSRIFDRFYKADKARTNAKGSGLGLAITKELVERMGGKISAECREGRFSIRVLF
ncbi:MAG: HAMP domain-containing histidine kinase [Lachnospiraceae bacterium]|nr:HAMP domain-containing histidine kinase [Lachnospiraceae bacterium]